MAAPPPLETFSPMLQSEVEPLLRMHVVITVCTLPHNDASTEMETSRALRWFLHQRNVSQHMQWLTEVYYLDHLVERWFYGRHGSGILVISESRWDGYLPDQAEIEVSDSGSHHQLAKVPKELELVADRGSLHCTFTHTKGYTRFEVNLSKQKTVLLQSSSGMHCVTSMTSAEVPPASVKLTPPPPFDLQLYTTR